MSQVVPCPACGQHLKLPDSLLGRPVKCQCSHVFTAPLPTSLCPGCQAALPSSATSCPDCGLHLAPSADRTDTTVDQEDRLNICSNAACGTLNPPGERLCQRCGSPLPGVAGQIIAGKYRLEQPLATGGFGVVYRASVVATGEPVAVKEMISTEEKEFHIRRTFFRREAEILGQLQPIPIVPRLFDFIEEGSAAYLVIEFIPGDNLLNCLQKVGDRPFSVAQVAAWGAKLCEALAHMHRMNPPLIHRDMKPDNIMLQPDGQTIRLIDFGTAREMGSRPQDRVVAKTKVFTEGYAPQEQQAGKPEPRSDLFALAGTLYHLATGQAPDGHLTGQEIAKKLDTYPESERWFWEILAINLSQELCDRYMTARDMKGDLERRSITREIHCPKCGTATPAREPYCRGCASPIAPPGPVCHRCERPTRLGSRYCIICGARL